MINEKPLSVVLLLILVVTPWCYGGVDESTQFWIALGLAVLGVASLVLPKSKVPHRLIIATIPLGLAFAWGLFQLIPWPRFVANFVSPRTVELRLELDVDPETVATRPTQLHAFSLHPAATRYHLALFSLGVGGFYLGATLFRTPSAVLWLCGAVAVNGAALSIFGLIQKLTWNGRIYWVGPVPLGYSVFASFVNRNHAGGYLNLCLAGAIGATIWSITRRPADSERSVREWPAVSDWRVFRIFAAVLSVFILAGIFATLSRGAMVALVVGVLIIAAGFATSGRPKTQLAWIAAIFAAGFVIVAWAGMYEPLKDRLGTLVQKDELISSGRLPNWIDALRSLPDFWHTGSGLGTYRDIYPLYQHRFDARVYSYAENQYLQALIEAGFPGLLLMLAQIILVALACRKLIGGGSDHASFAAGMAATFALSTQVIQGLFDWGLYLPSNMLLLAVFCGACVTFAGHGDRNVGKPLSRTSRWYFPAFGRVTLAILIGLLIYSAIEFRGAARVENALRYAKYSRGPETTENTLRTAIQRFSDALELRPDDARMHYEMGEALLHLYRIKRLESMRGTSPPTTILATLWDQTSIHRLHQHGHGAAHRDPTVELDPRTSDRLHETYLEPALQHFRHARRGCCLLPKVHLRLALLSFLTDDPGIDALHLRRARATAPSDPEVWAECGRLEMQAGRHEIACADWRHCLSLDPALVNTIFDYAANWIDTEVLVREALPESPQFLLDLATTRFRRESDEAAHRLLVTRARQALDRTDLEEAQRCYFQAVIETLSGDVERAIFYYSKAIPLRPNELAWRYQYAELLLSQGNLDEAHVQIRWCARMEPESAKYRRLLEQITQGRLRRD